MSAVNTNFIWRFQFDFVGQKPTWALTLADADRLIALRYVSTDNERDWYVVREWIRARLCGGAYRAGTLDEARRWAEIDLGLGACAVEGGLPKGGQ